MDGVTAETHRYTVTADRIAELEAELRMLRSWRSGIIETWLRHLELVNQTFDEQALPLHRELTRLRAAQPKPSPKPPRQRKPPAPVDLGSDEDNAHYRELAAKFNGI